MPGINLELIITPQITSIVPKRLISLFLYGGYINDNSGLITSIFTEYPNLKAQVQLENNQNLTHLNSYNITTIYKRFYIQSYTLTGLDRNINTGGDYIQMDGLQYKIVEVQENFKVGWVCVIGAESISLNG